MRSLNVLTLALLASSADAQTTNLAAAFAARPQVMQASMSPDGRQVAMIMPGKGRAHGVVIVDLASGALKPIYAVAGDAGQISECSWVGNTRLACTVWGVFQGETQPEGYSMVVAMDDSGANTKMLTRRQSMDEEYAVNNGGNIIDLLPDQEGSVLMTRNYAPQTTTGTIVKADHEGLGVDRIETRTGTAHAIQSPDRDAIEFITDGHGQVRVRGTLNTNQQGYSKGAIIYSYRPSDTSAWRQLSVRDYSKMTGFNPYAVDPKLNVAYGLEPVGGRDALVSYKLDGTLARSVVFQHPSVDVGGLVTIGRAKRVIGVSYTTERTHTDYFDPDMKSLQTKLSRALGGEKDIGIVDTSADERKAIVWAGSDTDPGRFYVLDRNSNKLALLSESNPELAGVALSPIRAITYAAKDGTMIPAYLTLPKNSTGKNLPAIVLPHGGPESRDYWGFDILSQYFVARGFAVIQPQYRGSAGFGSAWYQKNGFRGWRTSIGDVNDAGHYLISSGIADPAKLVIFGWSYGGYAALQANVLEPGLFKAAVAVAPVTDLGELRASRSNSVDFLVEQERLISGNNIAEGSPARNAARIHIPVLMFHGTYDLNVPVAQSKLMNARLHAVGGRSELVIFDKLDHQLNDQVALATVLQRSGDFLAAAGK